MMKEKIYRSTPEYLDVVPDTEFRQDDVAEKIRSFAETPAEARYREMEPSSPEIVALTKIANAKQASNRIRRPAER